MTRTIKAVIVAMLVLGGSVNFASAQAWIMTTLQEGPDGETGLMSGIRLYRQRGHGSVLLASVREVITLPPQEVRLRYAVPKSIGEMGPIQDIEVTATIRRAQDFDEAWPLPLSGDGVKTSWHIDSASHHEASQLDECANEPCDFVPYEMPLKGLFPFFLGEAGGFVPGVYELRVELRLGGNGALLPLYGAGDAIAGFRDAWKLAVERNLGPILN